MRKNGRFLVLSLLVVLPRKRSIVSTLVESLRPRAPQSEDELAEEDEPDDEISLAERALRVQGRHHS